MRKGAQFEREFIRLMLEQGNDCHRIAGSGMGKEAVCDCIVFADGRTILVEVKATKEKLFYFRDRVKKQLEQMMAVCTRHNFIPLLAVKFKRRGWNFVQLPAEGPIQWREEHDNQGKSLCFTARETEKS